MDAPATADRDHSVPQPRPEPSPDPLDGATQPIVLGVAGRVADGLDVDALWVRMAFVLLTLIGGIGIVAYLGLWLVLFGPSRTGLPFVRVLGGAVVVGGVPLLIVIADEDRAAGPTAVVALLIGLTLALWQPRRAPTDGAPPAGSVPLPPTEHQPPQDPPGLARSARFSPPA